MNQALPQIMPVLPETVLLCFTVLSVVAGVCAAPSKAKKTADGAVFAGLAAAFCLLFLLKTPNEPFAAATVTLKRILTASAAAVLAFGADWLKYKKYERFEFAPLVGFSTAGMMLAVGADNFLMQFLGLELAFFPLLFLTAYKRQGERSTAAGAKLAVMMLLASGVYLFGVSVVYACLGTVDFAAVAAADKSRVLPVLLWGGAFVAAGLFTKAGVAPFHLWLPDVFEGAPSPVTAMFVLTARLSVLGALAALLFRPFTDLAVYARPVLETAAVLSVFAGGAGAVVQTNVKRLIACSVVAMNGTALAALAVSAGGTFLMLSAVDTVLTAGLCAIMLSLRVGDELIEETRILAGQGRAKPVRGALFSLIFLGAAGAPPFAGFLARFDLYRATAAAGLTPFCLLLVFGAMPLTYVYLRLIRQMYAAAAKDELSPAPLPMKAVILLSAAVSSLMFVATGF